MRHALQDLDLDEVIVVHAGKHEFPLADKVTAIPAGRLLSEGFTSG